MSRKRRHRIHDWALIGYTWTGWRIYRCETCGYEDIG